MIFVCVGTMWKWAGSHRIQTPHLMLLFPKHGVCSGPARTICSQLLVYQLHWHGLDCTPSFLSLVYMTQLHPHSTARP